ncbi:MAG: ABC-F family ATP-binding cassette domain-containing protein [Rhodothermales bacterium]
MIQLQNIFLAFGGRTILDEVSWSVRERRLIGLVGPNGAGKTTLLRLISGEIAPDGGSLSYGGWRVGYLRQDTEERPAERTVIEEALQAFQAIQKLEDEEHRLLQRLEDLSDHTSDAYIRAMEAFNRVHEELVARDVHMIRPRTESVLSGLGFSEEDFDRPLNTFSGGWRMRVALARLLLDQPDVLLLDEPTNHLDIESIAWLEVYLKTYPGTVILVSHDRRFLDRMTDWTVELSQGHLTEYAGNYTYYLGERAIRREHQRAAYENQQKFIQDTERFIERFRSKASKATQVQSRVKSLEKLERIPPPPPDEAHIQFRFPTAPRSGKIVLTLSRFSKTYQSDQGAVEVFRNAEGFAIERGQKIALIGRNGAGKSTLARMILGKEPFDGERTVGHNVETTFFAQHQAESLNPSLSALDSLREIAYDRSETELRSILGAFLFRGDDVFKPVRVLSGGERSRIALARTLTSPANLLVLDEPTNHLDLQSIQVLIEALRQYSGTFVLISHDRHFLDAVASTVWRVEDGHIEQYDGSYADFEWKMEQRRALAAAADRTQDQADRNRAAAQAASRTAAQSGSPGSGKPASTGGGPKTKEQKRLEAEARQREADARKRKGSKSAGLNDYQLQKRHDELEKQIMALEARKEELEAALADPSLFADAAKGKSLMATYERVQAELKPLYEVWEDVAEEISARAVSS